jgi:tRNA (guanosine-2'-O-)-methyltransferase
MFGFTESFNISVSAAISLYQLSERLRSSKINFHLSQNELIDIKLGWAKSTVKMAEPLIKDFLLKNL